MHGNLARQNRNFRFGKPAVCSECLWRPGVRSSSAVLTSCFGGLGGTRSGYTSIVDVIVDRPSNPVADDVGALVAVIRPALVGVLQSISTEVVSAFGQRDQLPLRLLGRLRKRGDGDCGIAFEYAVHDAVISADPIVVERVADALNRCRIIRGNPASILFAIEKAGAQQLISTEISLITENSRVLTGQPGQPVKLQKHLDTLAAAFRRPGTRRDLPQSIRGLWKADLFLGSTEQDHWVGTTVKINPAQLEPAPGLRKEVVRGLPFATMAPQASSTLIAPSQPQ